ncbi:uncharacterized protein BDR25DRAFT_360080 [Lindgomyces ingoldianus]|uniref:Uncharacterized protein n=1 Tax=Lindgomyces ingoldianus TaxID=673940 RepID=A0ACB6QG67_9PLEO|nr:uncharacterized protein BDR25DRAFT_360080 [Lindgomyces ingoldianus]KAF2465916.1 hypothetical protein BDR25DRAFT_360080 [Lindgomyces ingoldianus]
MEPPKRAALYFAEFAETSLFRLHLPPDQLFLIQLASIIEMRFVCAYRFGRRIQFQLNQHAVMGICREQCELTYPNPSSEWINEGVFGKRFQIWKAEIKAAHLTNIKPFSGSALTSIQWSSPHETHRLLTQILDPAQVKNEHRAEDMFGEFVWPNLMLELPNVEYSHSESRQSLRTIFMELEQE